VILADTVDSTYGDYYFTAWGLILTLLGTFLAALKTVITNVIQTGGGGRLKLVSPHENSTSYTDPYASAPSRPLDANVTPRVYPMCRLWPHERRIEASTAVWRDGDDEGKGNGIAAERGDCVWVEHCQLYGEQKGWSKWFAWDRWSSADVRVTAFDNDRCCQLQTSIDDRDRRCHVQSEHQHHERYRHPIDLDRRCKSPPCLPLGIALIMGI
jgi:hypothetical protein